MSGNGIRTVARLELTQRLRTSKWPVVLGLRFAVVGGVSVLTALTVNDPDVGSGPAQYDLVIFFVLGLGMLVMPALTATSVNGDREHGVLATLQTTLLTPSDIVLGKLVASVVTALVFLVTALPFLIWAFVAGGVSIGDVLMSLLVLIVVLTVICAIGLMFSTLTARPVASAVLSYLSIAVLVFGTLIVFGLSYFLVDQQERVQVNRLPDSFYEAQADPNSPLPTPTREDCEVVTEVRTVTHTERTWWLLAVNPFVVVADAAPAQIREDDDGYFGFTPMRYISTGVRIAREGAGTDAVRDECYVGNDLRAADEEQPDVGPVWPFGLAGLVVLGAGATLVARRRLVTPVRRLPNGTRIA